VWAKPGLEVLEAATHHGVAQAAPSHTPRGGPTPRVIQAARPRAACYNIVITNRGSAGPGERGWSRPGSTCRARSARCGLAAEMGKSAQKVAVPASTTCP